MADAGGAGGAAFGSCWRDIVPRLPIGEAGGARKRRRRRVPRLPKRYEAVVSTELMTLLADARNPVAARLAFGFASAPWNR
jgi:hypothetical protein